MVFTKVYDHLLTLESEVKIIWPSKWRPSTYWFIAVRYLSLFSSATMTMYYFGDLSPKAGQALRCARRVIDSRAYSGTILPPPISRSQQIYSCSELEKAWEWLLLLQEVLVEGKHGPWS